MSADDRTAFARALYLGTMTWAIRNGSTPARMEAAFRDELAAAGLHLTVDATRTDSTVVLLHIHDLLMDPAETDRDVKSFRDQVLAIAVETAGRPDVFQSMSLALLGSGLIMALAVIGKLKYKNGKWELAEGLPELEKIFKAMPDLFRLDEP